MQKILFKTLKGLGITVGVVSTAIVVWAFSMYKEYLNSPSYSANHTTGESISDYFKYCDQMSKGFPDANTRRLKYSFDPTMYGWYCRNLSD